MVVLEIRKGKMSRERGTHAPGRQLPLFPMLALFSHFSLARKKTAQRTTLNTQTLTLSSHLQHRPIRVVGLHPLGKFL